MLPDLQTLQGETLLRDHQVGYLFKQQVLDLLETGLRRAAPWNVTPSFIYAFLCCAERNLSSRTLA